MLTKNYPLHDINIVFNMFEDTIKGGGVADNTLNEMLFLNTLFAALPADGVECGMRFLHGERNLPKSCDEIMPLFIRFLNLAEYLEKVEALRDIPSSLTDDEIKNRQELMGSLDTHENAFLKPLLGFKYNVSESRAEPDEQTDDEAQESSVLHLMNACAPVFRCNDIVKTAIFYESKCGFRSTHLTDETMPHIRLVRDNIAIVLTEGEEAVHPGYSMYIYVSEPFLLQNELRSAGVKIIKELPEAEAAQKSTINREFIFEDCDGRLICVSQSNDIV